MRAISLFSGAGGFECGFDRAGIQTVLQAEQDQWCLEVLARHWPETERVTDVRSVGSQREPAGRNASAAFRPTTDLGRRQAGTGLFGGVDLVYGGFPCQDVSVAGKRAGLSGERSGLWHEFHRVLRELRPRWCVIENVPGLLSSNSGRDFATILLGLGELGYGWAYRILDARWFGVPQRRRRVFVVGCLGDAGRAAQVLAVCESCGGHPQTRPETGQGTPISTDASVAGTLGGHHGNVRADQSWTNQLVTAATLSSGGHPGSNLPGRHKEDDENLVVQPEARALTARASGYRMDGETENFVVAGTVRSHPRPGSNDAGGIVAGAQSASDGHHGHSSPCGDGGDNLIAFHQIQDPISERGRQPALGSKSSGMGLSDPAGVRRLTPLECERLMAWPDGWTKYTSDGREIPDSHRYRLCGNGVVATCAEWIGHRLMKADQFMTEAA